jgi:hypothetical protein
MHGSPWSVFEHAPVGNRKFSHLWVGVDGRVEQYAPLGGKSWAQGVGNAGYWSVETDGLPHEPLTDAQLDALAAWHVFCGAVDTIADAPGRRGIGTHQMGGAAWGDGRSPHTCPDPAMGLPGPRSRQRGEILRRAKLLRTGGTTVTPDDIDDIANAFLAKLAGWIPPATGDIPPINWQTLITRDHKRLKQIEDLLTDEATPPKKG